MKGKNISKKRTKSELSRKQLLDAARELFSDNLIEEVGVREISAKAGVTTGMFYYYFDGKDDIIDQLYLSRDEELGVVIETYSMAPPYKEKIVRYFAETMSRVIENDGVDFSLHRMFTMRKRSDESMQVYKELIALIERAQKNGELDMTHDSKEINMWLWVLFRGVVYDWCMDNNPSSDSLSQRMATAVSIMLDGFSSNSSK